MNCYYVITKNGFIGTRHFDYAEDAHAAAELMNQLEGCDSWTVRKIIYTK